MLETETSPAPTREQYDLILLGCGTASKLSAWNFAGQGQRVAVVERKYVGGSRPNIACLPSKNFVYSAQVASYARRLREFGMSAHGFQIQMEGVRRRKRDMVAREVEMHRQNFERSGAELIFGEGRFVGPKTIRVALPDGTFRVLEGKKIVIGTGSHASIEDIPGLIRSAPMTHLNSMLFQATSSFSAADT